MSLRELIEFLKFTPVIANIHPISIAFLRAELGDKLKVYSNIEELVTLLDSPMPDPPHYALISKFDPRFSHRFPYITCEHNPFTPALNLVLFDQFEYIAANMLSQSRIADRIFKNASKYHLIALILVDGLSYIDAITWASETLGKVSSFNLEACLVDGPSLTKYGFTNIVGEPPIASRLFLQGFVSRLGFTYWDREDNILTNRLFSTIEVKRVVYFSEILELIRKLDFKKPTYIQIIRAGLDNYAHRHKDKPPLDKIVQQIFLEIVEFIKVLDEKRIKGAIFMTSDHGILWRWEHQFKVLNKALGTYPQRFYTENDKSPQGKYFKVEESFYWCLNYPEIRRNFHRDEQGTHGGISFEESVVPFIQVEVG